MSQFKAGRLRYGLCGGALSLLIAAALTAGGLTVR